MSEKDLAYYINTSIPGRLWILIYEGDEVGEGTILKMPHKISHDKIITVLENVIEQLR